MITCDRVINVSACDHWWWSSFWIVHSSSEKRMCTLSMFSLLRFWARSINCQSKRIKSINNHSINKSNERNKWTISHTQRSHITWPAQHKVSIVKRGITAKQIVKSILIRIHTHINKSYITTLLTSNFYAIDIRDYKGVVLTSCFGSTCIFNGKNSTFKSFLVIY